MKGRITQVSSRSRTRGKTDFKSIKGFLSPEWAGGNTGNHHRRESHTNLTRLRSEA